MNRFGQLSSDKLKGTHLKYSPEMLLMLGSNAKYVIVCAPWFGLLMNNHIQGYVIIFAQIALIMGDLWRRGKKQDEIRSFQREAFLNKIRIRSNDYSNVCKCC